MWVRLQLDFRWRDMLFGMSRLGTWNAPKYQQRVENWWSADGAALACLSVRSGLDLVFQAMSWPKDSEIIYSALNIPDMTMVAQEHGLVPVPADLDLETLAPNLRKIEQAITPKTKAIVVAHLYGNFVQMEPIARLAKQHGLMLIEDGAEVFEGQYRGHPEADISLFSFGPLKTATAFAGGIAVVRDPQLRQRMRQIQEAYPRLKRRNYFARMCKYSTLKFCGQPLIYGTVRTLARLAVGDVDKLINHSVKSFRLDEIMRRLREKPNAALLATLERRLRKFPKTRLASRTAKGRYLAELLRDKVCCPGGFVEPHSYWLFPVMVDQPLEAIKTLAEAGFDASQIQSMRPIEAPADRPHLDPVQTREAVDKILLLPCYGDMSDAELEHMAQIVIAHQEKSASRVQSWRTTDTAAPRRMASVES